MRWVNYMNKFHGARLVLLGRGPSLSLYKGTERNDVTIAINSSTEASFSISGHILKDVTRDGYIHAKSQHEIEPLIDIRHHRLPVGSVPWAKMDESKDWFLPLHHGNSFTPSKVEMARYSCIPISVSGVAGVRLGWFLGCSSMIAYGCDGGFGYAKDFGINPNGSGYDKNRELVELEAKKCFGHKYEFVVAKKETGQ
jgi:hypothetical protein